MEDLREPVVGIVLVLGFSLGCWFERLLELGQVLDAGAADCLVYDVTSWQCW